MSLVNWGQKRVFLSYGPLLPSPQPRLTHCFRSFREQGHHQVCIARRGAPMDAVWKQTTQTLIVRLYKTPFFSADPRLWKCQQNIWKWVGETRPSACHRSIYCFSIKNPFRKKCLQFVEWKPFEFLILLTILGNCVALAVYTPFPSEDTNEMNLILVSTSYHTILCPCRFQNTTCRLLKFHRANSNDTLMIWCYN